MCTAMVAAHCVKTTARALARKDARDAAQGSIWRNKTDFFGSIRPRRDADPRHTRARRERRFCSAAVSVPASGTFTEIYRQRLIEARPAHGIQAEGFASNGHAEGQAGP